jgi:hypothetical protein
MLAYNTHMSNNILFGDLGPFGCDWGISVARLLCSGGPEAGQQLSTPHQHTCKIEKDTRHHVRHGL